MSIFDTDNVITEEYLLSRGFKRDIDVTSTCSNMPNRFAKQIYRENTESSRYRYLVANLIYYLDPQDEDHTPQYTFYMGYRDYTDVIGETWNSKEFSNIYDKIEFETCINEFNKILDSVKLRRWEMIEELKTKLENGIVEFTFKKQNGEIRNA